MAKIKYMQWTNKIYLGDAYKLIKELPDKSIDLIITDPPYKIATGGKGQLSRYSLDEIRNNSMDK